MCLAWWQARLFGRGFELSSKGHEWDVSARDRTALMTWKSIWSGARNIATRPFSRMWRVVFETCFAKSVRPMTFRLSKAMWARITFISMFPILPNYPSVRWSSVWNSGNGSKVLGPTLLGDWLCSLQFGNGHWSDDPGILGAPHWQGWWFYRWWWMTLSHQSQTSSL